MSFSASSIALVLLWSVASCSQPTIRGSMNESEQSVQKGVWGGDHIRLDVTDDGALIEYDCAHGTIDGPLRVDAQGRFTANGTHVAERGGPVREGDEPKPQPARYNGHLSGETMKLTVTLPASNQEVGTFTLVRGKQPRLTKCL
jgi:hypothetical protein